MEKRGLYGMKRRGILILIGGKSGSGKSTLVNGLIHNFPNIYCRPKSYSSRARRENEENEYIFQTREQIKNRYKEGKLINLDEVYGNIYGICKNDVDIKLSNGMYVIKEVFPDNFHKFTSYPNKMTVLITNRDAPFINRSDTRTSIDNCFFSHKTIYSDLTYLWNEKKEVRENVFFLHEMIEDYVELKLLSNVEID